MNTQEILNNLSNLEKELQNIQSARVLAENTITAYQDTQKEIGRLIEELKDANASLTAIAKGLKGHETALSDNFNQGIDKAIGKLSDIGTEFTGNYSSVTANFGRKVSQSINSLTQDAKSLIAELAARDSSLKCHIDEFGTLKTSIARVNTVMNSIENTLASFQESSVKIANSHDANITHIWNECSQIREKLNALDDRNKAAGEMLQKSSKHVQTHLIILIILTILSIVLPFIK